MTVTENPTENVTAENVESAPIITSLDDVDPKLAMVVGLANDAIATNNTFVRAGMSPEQIAEGLAREAGAFDEADEKAAALMADAKAKAEKVLADAKVKADQVKASASAPFLPAANEQVSQQAKVNPVEANTARKDMDAMLRLLENRAGKTLHHFLLDIEGAKRARSTSTTEKDYDPTAVRSWGIAQGMLAEGSKGRIADDVIDAFKKANPTA